MTRAPMSLIAAALVAWVPPVALVIGQVNWTSVPDEIPVHWSAKGVIDHWESTDAAFWVCLVPGVVGALVISVLVAANGADISRVRGSAGLGVISALTGSISMMWFVGVLTAQGDDVSFPPFLLVAASIAWGAVVFAVAALSPRRVPAER